MSYAPRVMLAALLLPATAAAQPYRDARTGIEDDRAQGIAEVGAGFLTLPDAEVCVDPTESGCTTGDTSLELDAWMLYRPTDHWAAGAGVTLGLTPTTDLPRDDPPGLPRNHSRGYMMIEATGRHYVLALDDAEIWLGGTAGLVVVNDSFATANNTPDKALVGNHGVTIRTEGWTAGLGVGGSYVFDPAWAVGVSLRYMLWVLPDDPATAPTGDEASLAGNVSAFTLGINVSYRTPL